ncbi:MAG: hypothetical protein Q8L14_16075 [Myxococcales bacterium]|nr:hypothetical protein [Myxococcales bacterium]
MAGLNGITAPNGLNSSGVGLDNPKLTGHLQSAHVGSESPNKNLVVPDSVKKKAEPLLESLPSTIKPSATEQGHGTPPTPAQLEFERKAKEREDIIKQNASIKESNRDLNAQIGKAETAKSHLSALANVWDLSASFTRAELNDYTNSATLSPEIKAAARWLLSQSDADLAALGLRKGEGGVTKDSINTVLGSLEGKISDLRAQIRPELPVPGEPVPPPASNQNPTSSTNSSTGTNNTNGTNTSESGGAASTDSKQPAQTGAEFRAKALANSNKVPDFVSTATTGEGRMQDGLQHCQNKLDALQTDLADAAARGDQGAISIINAEIAKFQAGLSALMQMLKQQQEMQSNMSKMFNEMASSAIRNMR